MDTRIWMQESFWESAEKQSVKESPQENAEHLSNDQNENGGNKLVDQRQVSGSRRMRIFWLGWDSAGSR